MDSLLNTALAYRSADLSVLPAHRERKCPALKEWKPFQSRLPTDHEVRAWFSNRQDGLCLICGGVSGNLEMLDFDLAGELFEAWSAKVEQAAPGLMERLVIETSPSGGWHVCYRCEVEICKSMKLAQRQLDVDGHEPVTIQGKQFKPRKDESGQWHILLTLIETRGEGGLFLCAPTPGYELVQGEFTNLPIFSEHEREVLLTAAWELNEYVAKVHDTSPAPSASSTGRPGDDFNEHGDVRPVLEKYGWTQVNGGENEHWRRPGKEHGTSATLKDGVFYVFSSNAPPFEPDQPYSPFYVYTLLEHNGDPVAAASALRKEGYGALAPMRDEVDISGILAQAQTNRTEEDDREKDVEELMQLYPKLRPPVIHGLLREGETMNVVSAPKIGKSWLVNHLAISVATGGKWLGFDCVKSDVLVIDNELHPESSIYRLLKVTDALGINIRVIKNKIRIRNLRGKLKDLIQLGDYLQSIPPGKYKVIILDAFYRFLPQGMDENDNGTMANLYNYIDNYADLLECSFVIIHHTSKGNQSMKDITDVGAGAGSQSRATDTHVVLRRHEEEDVVSLDAVARSWPPPEPRCLRWEFPIWETADDLDPNDLKQQGGKKKTEKSTDVEATESIWDADSFVAMFISEKPKSKARITEDASAENINQHRVNRLLSMAEEDGLVFRWGVGASGKVLGYATIEQDDGESKKKKRKKAEDLILEQPELSTKDIAERSGITPQYVNRLRRKLQ